MTEPHELRDEQHTVRTVWPPQTDERFLPWIAGQQGQQTFLKLSRKGDDVLVYAGVAGAVQADLHPTMMKLVNEGYELQGEVQVTFDGNADPEMEAIFGPEICVLEIGSGLLPLVDPYQHAPLLEKIRDVRREVARDLGVTVPGLQVRDDLTLESPQYRLRLRGVPLATGQIFLDRFLAVGSLEQLAAVPGWTTTEPTYRLPAKWIEPTERDKAEGAGCMLLGGLAVLLTHVRDALRSGAPQLLGLQETHQLLMRLRQSHPIVVEEMLSSIHRVRKVRHVLHALLAEDVPIRDLITILEVLGDHIDELDDTERSTERVRTALAREILHRHADDEGTVRGLVLSDEAEQKVREEAVPRDHDGLVRIVREALDEHAGVTVLFTAPDVRRTVRARLERNFPQLSVVSLADIVRGARVEIAGQVNWKQAPAEVPSPPPPTEPPPGEEAGGFWKTRKKK